MCQKSGEISLLKQQLKESQAELVQKGSELVALRVALREARAALRVSEGRARGLQEAARTRELELEACSQELQRHRQEAERLREKAGQLDSEAAGLREPPVPPAAADPFLLAESDEAKAQRAAAGVGGSLRAQVERLRAELQRERRRGEEQRDSFEGERLAWQAEKEQVIRYQKQLQHNYIQMYRRNRQLEQELQQLRSTQSILEDKGKCANKVIVTKTGEVSRALERGSRRARDEVMQTRGLMDLLSRHS